MRPNGGIFLRFIPPPKGMPWSAFDRHPLCNHNGVGYPCWCCCCWRWRLFVVCLLFVCCVRAGFQDFKTVHLVKLSIVLCILIFCLNKAIKHFIPSVSPCFCVCRCRCVCSSSVLGRQATACHPFAKFWRLFSSNFLTKSSSYPYSLYQSHQAIIISLSERNTKKQLHIRAWELANLLLCFSFLHMQQQVVVGIIIWVAKGCSGLYCVTSVFFKSKRKKSSLW